MLRRERDGDLAALVEDLGRRSAEDELTRNPGHTVFDEIAVEEPAREAPASGVRGTAGRTIAAGPRGGERREMDIGGAQRRRVLVAARRAGGGDAQRQPVRGVEDRAAIGGGARPKGAGDEIGGADEIGDEAVARPVIDVLRRTDLLDPAAI